MRFVVFGLLALLVVLHQDFWNWHTHEPLVFGFIPIGLAWHVGISIAAAGLAALAARYCWPRHVDVPHQPASSDHAAAQAHPNRGHTE